MVPKSQLGPVLGNLNYQWCVCNQRFGILKAWKSKSEGRGFESRFWLPFSFDIFPLKNRDLAWLGPSLGPPLARHRKGRRDVAAIRFTVAEISRKLALMGCRTTPWRRSSSFPEFESTSGHRFDWNVIEKLQTENQVSKFARKMWNVSGRAEWPRMDCSHRNLADVTVASVACVTKFF